MVRNPGSHEVGLMAIDTIISHSCKGKRIISGMAIDAAQVAMDPDQGEPVLFVQFRNVIHQPGVRCVASHAIITNGHRMHIDMARKTIRRNGFIESHGSMTRSTIQYDMLSDQRKSGTVMVKDHRIGHGGQLSGTWQRAQSILNSSPCGDCALASK